MKTASSDFTKDVAMRLADPDRPVETIILPPRNISTTGESQSSSSRSYELQSSSRTPSHLDTPQSSSDIFHQSYSSQTSSQLFLSPSYASQSFNSQLSRSRSPSPHAYASQSFETQSQLYASQPFSSRSSSTYPHAPLQQYASQAYMSQSTSSSQSHPSRSSTPQLFAKKNSTEQLSFGEEKLSNERAFVENGNSSKVKGKKSEVLHDESSDEEVKGKQTETLHDESSDEELLSFEEEYPIREKEKEKRPSNIVPEIVHTERFSTLITEEHVVEISSWIDRRKDYYDKSSNPYVFRLLVRGSRDGFNPKTFWERCDGYAETIVVLRVKGTNEILGGYNPIAWDKESPNRKIKTMQSFIFSLNNGVNSKSILSRVNNDDVALWYYPQHTEGGYGPWFGNGNLGMKTASSDFTKDTKCCANPYTKWYELPIRTSDEWFSIDEYEVFHVHKL
ncbi:11698_t:CDS:1 [Acaulospora colombiana]|uniref:11698_t:CDS:1 n=1 Tax=Acaulospora colombiana TaxID=27376 RepID=A0ACA9P618_9GLOM|nr:11698_t:CDS:1 [Acaulospora colombiana]